MVLILLQSFSWTVRGANIHTFRSYTQGCKGKIDTNMSGRTGRIVNLGQGKVLTNGELVPPRLNHSSKHLDELFLSAYREGYTPVKMHFSLKAASDLNQHSL